MSFQASNVRQEENTSAAGRPRSAAILDLRDPFDRVCDVFVLAMPLSNAEPRVRVTGDLCRIPQDCRGRGATRKEQIRAAETEVHGVRVRVELGQGYFQRVRRVRAVRRTELEVEALLVLGPGVAIFRFVVERIGGHADAPPCVRRAIPRVLSDCRINLVQALRALSMIPVWPLK